MPPSPLRALWALSPLTATSVQALLLCFLCVVRNKTIQSVNWIEAEAVWPVMWIGKVMRFYSFKC